jgi:hypothetical protein
LGGGRALRQLRLGGMASVLETRLRQAQAEPMAPIDLISCLVSDELTRRSDRLLEHRRKQAGFRDPDRTLDNFDFSFIPKSIGVWSSTWPRAPSSTSAKTHCFSVPEERERATWRKPSDSLRFNKTAKCRIAKLTSCSMSWPRPLRMALARNTWNRWRRFRYSSLTTSACANSRRRPPRIFWKSSCAATNVSARCSHPTARSMTGESCWVMSPQSALCSIGSCIMAMCSSADPGAGVRRLPLPRKEEVFFQMGTLSPCPWDLSLLRPNGS